MIVQEINRARIRRDWEMKTQKISEYTIEIGTAYNPDYVHYLEDLLDSILYARIKFREGHDDTAYTETDGNQAGKKDQSNTVEEGFQGLHDGGPNAA